MFRDKPNLGAGDLLTGMVVEFGCLPNKKGIRQSKSRRSSEKLIIISDSAE